MKKRIYKLLAKIGKIMFPAPPFQDHRWSPHTKVAQVSLHQQWRSSYYTERKTIELNETGFRVFSQFEEDGLLLCIFSIIGMGRKIFVDLGSSDGINSNCANLAINWGWHGLFVDGDIGNIKRGEHFYGRHPDTWGYPPKFVQAFIKSENINQIITENGFKGEVDLLSIDLDGNDYWIWKSIDVVNPRVVIIETHIEFGKESIVVPYDANYSYPGRHPDYHGASPVALIKLAKEKGYRLIGSNWYGFNTIYMREGIGEEAFPEVSVDKILSHPRNPDRFKRFEAIKDWPYVTV